MLVAISSMLSPVQKLVSAGRLTLGAGASVTVSSGIGCTASDTIQVSTGTAIPPDLGNDTTLCEAFNVTLSPGNYQMYSWSTGSNSATITVVSDGIYAVTVLDASGCTDVDSIEFDLVPNPTADLGPDTALCPAKRWYWMPAAALATTRGLPASLAIRLPFLARKPFGCVWRWVNALPPIPCLFRLRLAQNQSTFLIPQRALAPQYHSIRRLVAKA